MSDIVYVSNEKELEASLPGNHGLTVIAADYEPAIFDGYNIQYYFNETLKPGAGKLYTLKHIFMPDTSLAVILKSDIYSKLLKKITDLNHSVAFILSINNVKQLRLCECFTAALYSANDERVISTPSIIGKSKISPGICVPVWSPLGNLDWQDLPGVLTDAFSDVFKGKYYSEEGFTLLLKLLTDKIPEITGGSKLRIYKPSMRHSRIDIEGSHKMLDTGDFVKRIESIATELLNLLKPHELIFPPNTSISHLYPAPRSAHTAVEQISPLIFEYSNNSMSEQEVETFCEDAYGTVLTLTPDAIDKRGNKFGDDNRSDDIGNIHSFVYKVYDTFDSGKLVVCPEGKEDLISELFGVQPNKNSAVFTHVADAAKQGNNNPRGKVTTDARGVVPMNQSDIPSKPSRKKKAPKGKMLIKVMITMLEGRKSFSITVNSKERNATSNQVLKFLAMYAASKTLGAHFLFLNKGKVIIRKGEKNSDCEIDLKHIFSNTTNVNSVIDKIVPVFLPKGSVLNNYIKKNEDGKYPSFQSRKEVKFCTRNDIKPANATDINLSVELDTAAKNAIKAALEHKSASQDLMNFILAVFK